MVVGILGIAISLGVVKSVSDHAKKLPKGKKKSFKINKKKVKKKYTLNL